MKTASDPRHQKRIALVKYLFAYSFSPGKIATKPIQEIITNLNLIDAYIGEHAPQWPVNKIAKIDLAILRLSIYELCVKQSAPAKVVVDEAVEIAKVYGNDTSPSFINGVLGAILKNTHEQN